MKRIVWWPALCAVAAALLARLQAHDCLLTWHVALGGSDRTCRIYTNSKQDSNMLQYSTVAFTSGAAVVTVVRWVSELK